MNHAKYAIAHEIKIRRWQTFTPPQSTAHAAHCGLVLHWRAYPRLRNGEFVQRRAIAGAEGAKKSPRLRVHPWWKFLVILFIAHQLFSL
jgi:hypothetical protein